ncbi:prephenate dehydrogenase [Candidatus Saccharibacteria bacterium]|nr:MAG: prephenate dehydrogenase [Candidatus Saccharibacteria bacterium]
MNNVIETVGFVGFGAMGQFMAEKMFPGSDIVAHDPGIHERQINNTALTTLAEVATRDTIVLAVPAMAHTLAVAALKEHLPEGGSQLIVDVSSVKEKPDTVLGLARLSDELLSCHPLFGRETAGKSLRGHRVIVTKTTGDKPVRLLDTWKELGLNIMPLSAHEHDQHMAAVQAVPLVLGRLVGVLNLADPKSLQTPARLKAWQLAEAADTHSEALLDTIVGNSHALPLVERMLAELEVIRDKHLALATGTQYLSRQPRA